MIGAENRSDQEVAPLELGFVLVDHDPDVEAACHAAAILRRCSLGLGEQTVKGRLACDLLDHVGAGTGHHKRLADRSVALRHDRGRPDARGKEEANRPVIEHRAVARKPVPVRPDGGRRQTTDHRDAGLVADELVDGKGEGICQQDQR